VNASLTAELLAPTRTTYQRVLAVWHGPRRDAFGVPSERLAGPMPAVLREFYAFAGRWPAAVRFNELVDPDALEVDDDGMLMFCAENQGVVIWATEPDGDDPPVYVKGSTIDDPAGRLGWRREGEPLSRFLLQLALFEAMQHAPFGGVALAQPREGWSAILAPLSELPLADWNWPAAGTRFWAADDAVAQVIPDEGVETKEVHVGARTAAAAAYLRGLPDQIWDTVWLDGPAGA
jgi:hypothetical protein